MLAGQMKRVSGGVGRNVADALGKFGHDVCFLSAVGDDLDGHMILKSLEHIVNNINVIIIVCTGHGSYGFRSEYALETM